MLPIRSLGQIDNIAKIWLRVIIVHFSNFEEKGQ